MSMVEDDWPDLDFYIEVEAESIRRRMTAMANDVDSPEDWHYEQIEAEMFEDDLKSCLVELMFDKQGMLDVIKELHKATGCSFAMAYSHAEYVLREFYGCISHVSQLLLRNLDE